MTAKYAQIPSKTRESRTLYSYIMTIKYVRIFKDHYQKLRANDELTVK